jgi:hypothetical protein
MTPGLADSKSTANQPNRADLAREQAYASLGSLRQQLIQNRFLGQTENGSDHHSAKLPGSAKPGVAITPPTLDAAFAAISG